MRVNKPISRMTQGEREALSLDQLEPVPATATRQAPAPPVAKARKIPLERLSGEAMLTLLHDARGLKHLLPVAVEIAMARPWADCGFHPGDLLLAILHASPELWPIGTKLHRGMVKLAKHAVAMAPSQRRGHRRPEVEAEVTRWLKRWEKIKVA